MTAVVACIVSFLFAFAMAELDIHDVLRTGLVSDVNAYERISDAVWGGGLPYVDVPIEHLPVSALAILVIGGFSELTGFPMWILWPLAMSACFVATTLTLDRVALADGYGFRFVVVAAPLLPLALYRIEPWVVLITVLGVAAWAGSRVTSATILTIAGALAKGWPVVIAGIGWRLGRRTVAVVSVVLSGLALLAMTAVDGFRSGRTFEGIHSETMVGSIALVVRHLTDSPLELVRTAGAIYVDVPSVWVIINALPGLAVIGLGVWAMLRSNGARLLEATGLVTAGIVLASPLASTQFIWWLAPFAAFAVVRVRRSYMLAATIGLLTVSVYEIDSAWWSVAVLACNVVLYTSVALWLRSVLPTPRPAP